MQHRPLVFASADAIGLHAARLLLDASAAAAAAGRHLAIAVSGGSVVPLLKAGLVEAFASKEAGGSTYYDCSHWRIFLADERCVPRAHADSNTGLIDSELMPLLIAHGASPQVAMRTPDFGLLEQGLQSKEARDAAAREYDCLLRAEAPQLDVVLLGMGPDGHTCSLFPRTRQPDDNGGSDIAMDLVIGVGDSPKPPCSRISLTYEALRQSRKIIFMCAGAGKADALKDVFGDAGVRQSQLPSAIVTRGGREQNGADGVVWLVDTAAAARISQQD